MDIETIRIVMTVVLFVTFIGIVLWTWSRGPARGFEQAARLPFEEDEEAHHKTGAQR